MFAQLKDTISFFRIVRFGTLGMALSAFMVCPAFAEAFRVTRGGAVTVSNPSLKACPAGIIIAGLQQFANPKGIEWQGHAYYFFESDTSLTNLKGVASMTAGGNSPTPASGNSMMVFKPMGTAMLPLDVRVAGTYYFHVRMLPYGNSSPTLALSAGGQVIGTARGAGWQLAGHTNLTAGRHEIVLTEFGTDDPTVPSARLAALDCISISTDPKAPLWSEVTTSASNPSNTFWLNRVGIPTRNPMLTLGQQKAGVTASLDDGQAAIFFSDGTVTGMNLKKDLLCEDEKGLTIGEHIYLFYDLSDGGKAVTNAASKPGIPNYGIGGFNRNDFIALKPGGIWARQSKVLGGLPAFNGWHPALVIPCSG